MSTTSKLHPKFQSVVVISGLWRWATETSRSLPPAPTRLPCLDAHLLLGIYEDEADNKLLHIAGMRSSNGQGDASRDIPIVIRREDDALVEAAKEKHRL